MLISWFIHLLHNGSDLCSLKAKIHFAIYFIMAPNVNFPVVHFMIIVSDGQDRYCNSVLQCCFFFII